MNNANRAIFFFSWSPHMKSIHERIIAGKTGKPIAPTSFQELFRDNWKDLNAAIETEEGSLTHFEVSYLTLLLEF